MSAQPSNPLFEAIEQNNLPRVRQILDKTPEAITLRNESGATALHRAVAPPQKSSELIDLLVERKADLNAKTHRGSTPLHHTGVYKATSVAEQLITMKANPAECDAKGTPAFQSDTVFHAIEIVRKNKLQQEAWHAFELLLKQQNLTVASLNTFLGGKHYIRFGQDEKGRSSLHLVANHLADSPTFKQIVKYLIKQNANLEHTTTGGGRTALHFASELGRKEMVKLLLKAKADPNAKDKTGKTPADWAKESTIKAELDSASANYRQTSELLKLVMAGNIKSVKTLLGQGVDINSASLYNITPLHQAIMNNKWPMATFLLHARANVHACDRNLDTPLHYAVKEGNVEIVRNLLDAKADPQAVNKNLQTPSLAVGNFNAGAIIAVLQGAHTVAAPLTPTTQSSSSSNISVDTQHPAPATGEVDASGPHSSGLSVDFSKMGMRHPASAIDEADASGPPSSGLSVDFSKMGMRHPAPAAVAVSASTASASQSSSSLEIDISTNRTSTGFGTYGRLPTTSPQTSTIPAPASESEPGSEEFEPGSEPKSVGLTGPMQKLGLHSKKRGRETGKEATQDAGAPPKLSKTTNPLGVK